MSFIRTKKVGGRVYKYEVESYRGPDGTPRQRVLKYLGPEAPIYGTEADRKGAKKKDD